MISVGRHRHQHTVIPGRRDRRGESGLCQRRVGERELGRRADGLGRRSQLHAATGGQLRERTFPAGAGTAAAARWSRWRPARAVLPQRHAHPDRARRGGGGGSAGWRPGADGAGRGAAPIIWIGRREVDCTRHPKPRKVWPVRVAAGAFGPGRPHTDLFLSPDHAVYVNEVLIPIRHLINGSTIAQVPVDRVTLLSPRTGAARRGAGRGPAGGEFSGYAGRVELREPSRAGAAVSGFFRAHVGGVRLRAAGRHGAGILAARALVERFATGQVAA